MQLQGVTIGTVKTILVTSEPDRKLTPVEVVMKLDAKYQQPAEGFEGLADDGGRAGRYGGRHQQPVATGPPLQDGDELKTLETPSLTDVVKASQGTIESLNVILAKMNTIVDNLQTGKGSVGQLINNPDLTTRRTRRWTSCTSWRRT